MLNEELAAEAVQRGAEGPGRDDGRRSACSPPAPPRATCSCRASPRWCTAGWAAGRWSCCPPAACARRHGGACRPRPGGPPRRARRRGGRRVGAGQPGSLRQRRFTTGSRSERSTRSSCAGRSPTAPARWCWRPQPRPDRASLRVDWVHTVSYAHEHPVCMRAGLDGPTAEVGKTWLDRPRRGAGGAAPACCGCARTCGRCPGCSRSGLREFVALVRAGRFDPSTDRPRAVPLQRRTLQGRHLPAAPRGRSDDRRGALVHATCRPGATPARRASS